MNENNKSECQSKIFGKVIFILDIKHYNILNWGLSYVSMREALCWSYPITNTESFNHEILRHSSLKSIHVSMLHRLCIRINEQDILLPRHCESIHMINRCLALSCLNLPLHSTKLAVQYMYINLCMSMEIMYKLLAIN